MSEFDDITKSIVSEEERKKLIDEISKMKDVLDSFKYGLNFEQFADEIFKTIDRQTLAIKKLDELMSDIVSRMARLESQFKEGISIRVSSMAEGAIAEIQEGSDIILDDSVSSVRDSEIPEGDSKDTAELEQEAAEIEVKMARLFEKENELLEMVHNDPAGAEEYEDKARVAREMRTELESRLKKIKEQLR